MVIYSSEAYDVSKDSTQASFLEGQPWLVIPPAAVAQDNGTYSIRPASLKPPEYSKWWD
jgi:hypothetical protein